MPLFKRISAASLLLAMASAFSAEEILVDTKEALGPFEYSDVLARDVSCFAKHEECYLVLTGSVQQDSMNKNMLSIWKPSGKSGAEKLAALPLGDDFFRLISETNGNWLSVYVETVNSPPAVYVFNRSDKTFSNVSDSVGRYIPIDSLKSAKVTANGALALLHDTPAGCCEVLIMDIKSKKALAQKTLDFMHDQEISPLDFDITQEGYVLAGALSDTSEQIGAVSVSPKDGDALITAQGKDRYYYAVDAAGRYIYASGNSMEFGGGVLAVFLPQAKEKPELITELFSNSTGISTLNFSPLCGGYFAEAFTNQKTAPYKEFEVVIAAAPDVGVKADKLEFKVGTSSPLAFKSVIPYVEDDRLFIVINATEFDEVNRGFHNRIYRKEVAKFALCAND